jgi:cardiolipin synthase (CMP-forming)
VDSLCEIFSRVTLANKITIARLCLIPVFVGLASAYGCSVARGQPADWYRFGAVAVFLTAACSDGLDGFIARRFNQQSRLGSILDPIADKGLITATLLVLALARWPQGLPLWFPCIVIGRDVILVLGFAVLTRLIPKVTVRPSLAGKLATVSQLATIVWTLLSLPVLGPVLLFISTALTIVSGLGYVFDGCRQLRKDW